MDSERALSRIAAVRGSRVFTLIGIGGHGGAGKTTLARLIPDATVIGTDEFWNGQAFDLARLRGEVFDAFATGRAARFATFDWPAQTPGETRTVEPAGVIVVEGVCALHRMFRDDYDLRVWVDAPRDLRLARGIARDGEEARATWEEVWMPMEDRYVERDDPVAAADLIVDGTA